MLCIIVPIALFLHSVSSHRLRQEHVNEKMATSSFHTFLYSCQKFTFCRTYLTVFFHFVLSYACFFSKLYQKHLNVRQLRLRSTNSFSPPSYHSSMIYRHTTMRKSHDRPWHIARPHDTHYHPPDTSRYEGSSHNRSGPFSMYGTHAMILATPLRIGGILSGSASWRYHHHP